MAAEDKTREFLVRQIRLEAQARARRAEEMAQWTTRELALYDQLLEAEDIIVQAQDALTVDHPVWWLLDDYDGSGDSTKRMREYVQVSKELLVGAVGHLIVGSAVEKRLADRIVAFLDHWQSKSGYIHPTFGKEEGGTNA